MFVRVKLNVIDNFLIKFQDIWRPVRLENWFSAMNPEAPSSSHNGGTAVVEWCGVSQDNSLARAVYGD